MVEQLNNSISKKPAADVGTMSFEAGLKELESIVARLEQGEVDLEDSIALYEGVAKGETDADVRAWAVKKLPLLKEHAKMARALAERLKAAGTK